MTLNKAEKKIKGAKLDIFREKYVEKQNMVTLKEKWTYILLFVKESASQEDNRIFFQPSRENIESLGNENADVSSAQGR